MCIRDSKCIAFNKALNKNTKINKNDLMDVKPMKGIHSLDYKKILSDYDVIPQNSNFGIKSNILKNFLVSNSIELKKGIKIKKSNSEIAEKINGGTVFINCWMTKKQFKKLKTKKVMFNNLNLD